VHGTVLDTDGTCNMSKIVVRGEYDRMGLRASRPGALHRVLHESLRKLAGTFHVLYGNLQEPFMLCTRVGAAGRVQHATDNTRRTTHAVANAQDAQETFTHVALPLSDYTSDQSLLGCLTKFTAEETMDGARRPDMRPTPSNGPTHASCYFGADGALWRSPCPHGA